MRRACALLLALSAGCGDGTSCETGAADVGEVCLPGRIAPDVPVTLEVRELCGRGCTEPPGCSAIFRGAQVILDVEQEVCVDTLTPACLSLGCQERGITCKLPALRPGDWALSIPGAPPRLLRVQEGGAASCRFTPGVRVQ
jgi:hypothetical protein